MPQNRPSIPESMKREVRQRCGFGCVICGNPIITYEHIVPWAKVHKHEASNLTLLCHDDQHQSTVGLLPKSQILEADADPFTLRTGHTSPLPLRYRDDCSIWIGQIEFLMPGQEFVAIVVDDIGFIGFRKIDDQLVLMAGLFDNKGRSVCEVVENELTFIADQYDITFIGKVLTFRRGKKDILLQINFDAPKHAVYFMKGHLYCNGIEIEILAGGGVWIAGARSQINRGKIVGRYGLLINSPNTYGGYKFEVTA